METRSGGCLCGAVRYEVAGEPRRVGLCHCADCRKTSGSAFVVFAIWSRDAFRCTGETGTFSGRSFCQKCGSRVFSLRDDEAEIMAGSLDDAPTDLLPSHEIWYKRREAWLLPLAWADQFIEDRNP